MPRLSKKIFVAAIAVTILIFMLAYMMYFRALSVSVLVPHRQISIQVFGLGTVEARVLSKVGFKVGGTLVDLRVDHGDLVHKGQLLARLDNSEQQNRVAKAVANQVKAEANLQLAKANLRKARTDLALKRRSNQRRQKLLKGGAVAVETAEEAQAAAENAGAEVALAEASVTAAKAAVKDAKAQIGLDKVLLAQHVLLAPYDALIIGRHKELGTVLPAGEPVFTLVDPCTVWVRAFVDEAKAGHLAVGQRVEVRLRSLPGRRFAGKVARIDLESDRVGEERRVYVTWDHCPREFHLGEQAEVVIDTRHLKNIMLVPQVLVQGYSGSGGQIWTLEDGRLNLRQVSLGQSTLDGRLPILSGLPTGAQVLAVLPNGLRQGRMALPKPGARP